MDRKTFLASGAAALAAAAAPIPADATPPEAALPPAVNSYMFDLMGFKPEEFSGGTVRTIKREQFPVLKGISFAYVTIKPGAIRTPHWHSGNEVNFNIKGQTRVGILVGDDMQEFAVGEGQTSFIPSGWPHYIINGSATEAAQVLVMFTDADNQSFGLGKTIKSMPAAAVAQGLGVSVAVVNGMTADQPLLRL